MTLLLRDEADIVEAHLVYHLAGGTSDRDRPQVE
jgi:hypothetical protein